ncbi:MAG: hypothetical protein AB1649_01505 [Chloroflexota bacterium]
MKNYFVLIDSRKDRGGACSCSNRCKLELVVSDDSPDFLGKAGFADHDTIQGFCGACGKPLAFRRLEVSSVEDYRSV